jgi:Tol biopolymer transport system component
MEVVWSPDSRRIVFAADAAGPRDLFIKPSNGATPEKVLYASPALFKDPRAWSPDGTLLVFEEVGTKTERDLWVLPIGGGAPRPYLQTPFNESGAVFSHDGKWVAYASDESGRYEVYVNTFPEPRQKIKVSQDGAYQMWWRRDGKELIVATPDLRILHAVAITPGDPLGVGTPKRLMTLPRAPAAVSVTPDHDRVLVAMPKTEITTSRMTLVFDWVGLVKGK